MKAAESRAMYGMRGLIQTIIAMRPMAPNTNQIPFMADIPNSVRLIDPTMPEGATLTPPGAPGGWFSPQGTAINSIDNQTQIIRQLATSHRVDGIIFVTITLSAEDISLLEKSDVEIVTIETTSILNVLKLALKIFL